MNTLSRPASFLFLKFFAPYLTLPYLTIPYREDVLLPSAEASNGPNAHPQINRKVTKCKVTKSYKVTQVQYSPGSVT